MSDPAYLDASPVTGPESAQAGEPGDPVEVGADLAPGAGAALVQPVMLSYSDFRLRPHHCFACGELNEIGLHLKLNLEHGKCWTELELPRKFEGWEGIIHGGILCTILDEVMAWSLVAQDNWGVTARMSITFRKPVTVGRAIRAEGWITEDRRRIHVTAGRIVDAETGDELALAEATYVAASENRKRELKRSYGVGGGDGR
jgi:acyl-coenzyme A thioesterase PaaI-like protein